jgi:hypothetical protein
MSGWYGLGFFLAYENRVCIKREFSGVMTGQLEVGVPEEGADLTASAGKHHRNGDRVRSSAMDLGLGSDSLGGGALMNV